MTQFTVAAVCNSACLGDYMQGSGRRPRQREALQAGGCQAGGSHYKDGAWVPVRHSRQPKHRHQTSFSGVSLCQCQGGSVRCHGGERATQAVTPRTFAVGLSFKTSSKTQDNGRVSFNTGAAKIGDRTGDVSAAVRKILNKDRFVESEPSERKAGLSKRRLTSGKGTAKLFRLFPEVHDPAIRTSNSTGCSVGGEYYPYPASTSGMAACRCTDSGMLWCWQTGVPRCLGCMLGGAHLPEGSSYTVGGDHLTVGGAHLPPGSLHTVGGGARCTCQCKVKMSSQCLSGKVLDIGDKV